MGTCGPYLYMLDNGISWGVEICSTGGVDQNFEVNGFSITTTASS